MDASERKAGASVTRSVADAGRTRKKSKRTYAFSQTGLRKSGPCGAV
jgi:hypothetical protein